MSLISLLVNDWAPTALLGMAWGVSVPMTTAAYNVNNPFAVAVGVAKSQKSSYVLCHQPKTFDWRQRRASRHPLKKLNDTQFAEVRAILEQVMQLTVL